MNITKNSIKYSAFTLIEILVVVALVALLAALTIIAINPQNSFAKSRNVARWNGVRAIHDGLEQWIVDGNTVSMLLEGDGSPLANCAIGTTAIMNEPTLADGQIDLHSYLVGVEQEYIVDLPRDPTNSSGADTGYRICLFSNPVRFVVTAPGAELQEVISLPVAIPVDTLANGLVAHWQMNEASWNSTPSEVIDSSENALHGRAYGGATTVADGIGRAGTFNGSSGYVNIGNPAELAISGEMSVSFWIKPTSVVGGEKIMSKSGNAGSYGWDMQLENWGGGEAALQFRIATTGNNVDYSNYFCPTGGCNNWDSNRWYHVVGVYHPSEKIELFVDNVKYANIDSTIGASQHTNSVNFNIGRRPTGNGYFNGMIDEVRIYDRVLLDSEVTQLYLIQP